MEACDILLLASILKDEVWRSADGNYENNGNYGADGKWQMADGRWQMADGRGINAEARRTRRGAERNDV
jgi:hypothetical protein